MIADLHLQISLRKNISYLKNAYCTPPFKIADIREDKRESTLQLMLMSSSPGILDGDDYRMKIELDEGCSLSLNTQSYQRLFNMQGEASQQLMVCMADNCTFSYLPHPIVPHKNANFTAKNKLYLSSNCTLFWGEVLTCGRKLNGEKFLYSKYHNLTEVYLNGKLVIKENMLLSPIETNLSAIGQMEGFSHLASLIFLNEKADQKCLFKYISDYLSSEHTISSGISAAPTNGIIVRLLGNKAEQLYTILKEITQIIKTIILQ